MSYIYVLTNTYISVFLYILVFTIFVSRKILKVEPAWKNATQDPENKIKFKCNFCGVSYGGVFGAKKRIVKDSN